MTQPRETFTPEELNAVLDRYELGELKKARAFPKGAHAAAKVVLITDHGKYMLKRLPRTAGDGDRVGFSHELQRFLADRHFPLPQLVTSEEDDESMLRLDDSIYEIYEFIEGEQYDGSPEETREAGRVLAIYHRLVRDFRSEYKPTQGYFHDSEVVVKSFSSLREKLRELAEEAGRPPDRSEQLLEDIHGVYLAAAAACNELGLPTWETQIIHADWHPGNMLFQEHRIAAVLDYDAARISQRVLDVANGCLQFSWVTGDRDLSTWEDRTDRLHARQFLEGYDVTGVLTKAELRAIPFLMQQVLIAQAMPPILRTGTFAGLEAHGFLETMLKKVQWLSGNTDAFELDAARD